MCIEYIACGLDFIIWQVVNWLCSGINLAAIFSDRLRKNNFYSPILLDVILLEVRNVDIYRDTG